MRICVYTARSDERPFLEKFEKELCAPAGVEVIIRQEDPLPETVALAQGADCISIITTPVNAALQQMLWDAGTRFISTRSIGWNHIDVEAARKLGMRLGNVSYAQDAVANYTVMLILMSLRNIQRISRQAALQDYSLNALYMGRDMRGLTVGVAGAGRIGHRVMENLSGFGCSLVAYDRYKNPEVAKVATYLEWDEFLAASDVITLHMNPDPENNHIIDAASIAKMKRGVVLINTARGSLIDTRAFVDAVESGQIGAAALDVTEDEFNLYYKDRRHEPLPNRDLAVLRSYPNVIITPHMAFYTERTVSEMCENTLRSCIAFMKGEENRWEIK
jgi:D-lactate dehydrogenase